MEVNEKVILIEISYLYCDNSVNYNCDLDV
jgi:hypothetical protein